MPKLACIHGVHSICTHGFTIEIGPFLLKGKKRGVKTNIKEVVDYFELGLKN